MVRIVHLSTSKSGGAGLIAKKLSDIQCENGHDSQVLVRSDDITGKQNLLSKVTTLYSLKSATKNYHQVTPFSISSFDFRLLSEINPEIVYIHNWFNFLSIDDIRNVTNNFKTIFVLHDERLLTGGCHVTLGCNGYLDFCKKCPASRVPGVSRRSKSYLNDELTKFGRFGVVTPSRWLESRVIRSSLGNASVANMVIPNPASIAGLKQQQKDFSVEFAEALFVSNDYSIPYKGLKLLLKSLSSVNLHHTKYKGLKVTVLGSKKEKTFDLGNGISLDYKHSVTESQMQKLYSKSHFLFVPSASENHPGVINEAQLSGVVVIATNVGGISEMIVDSESGFLSENSSLGFQSSIERAFNAKSLTSIAAKARDIAMLRTSSEHIVELHNEIMGILLNE
jgi:glycosyltransferase involved in cell wall biosynthesis